MSTLRSDEQLHEHAATGTSDWEIVAQILAFLVLSAFVALCIGAIIGLGFVGFALTRGIT